MNKKQLYCIMFSLCVSFQFFSCGFKNADELNYEWKLTFEDQFNSFDTTKWQSV